MPCGWRDICYAPDAAPAFGLVRRLGVCADTRREQGEQTNPRGGGRGMSPGSRCARCGGRPVSANLTLHRRSRLRSGFNASREAVRAFDSDLRTPSARSPSRPAARKALLSAVKESISDRDCREILHMRNMARRSRWCCSVMYCYSNELYFWSVNCFAVVGQLSRAVAAGSVEVASPMVRNNWEIDS